MIAAALAVVLGASVAPRGDPILRAPAVAVTARLPLGRRGAGGETGAHSGDAWFGPDKVKHFFMSAFIQSVTYSALRGARVEHRAALAGASVATAGFGVGKELHDLRVRREFSPRDLAWDAAGAVAAGAMMAHTLR